MRSALKAILSRLGVGETEATVDPDPLSPRWGYQHPPLEPVRALLERQEGRYFELLDTCLTWQDELRRIPVDPHHGVEPSWKNDFLPPFDAVVLYGAVARFQPSLYLEVGSGNSTRFVRRAIEDHGLATRVVSIDPEPRAEIDALCDEVLRAPLQELEPADLPELRPGDLFFLDGSHRATMSSDVVVAMLEMIPRFPAGVLVQVHDVYLPNDYPPEWVDRDYSEQYLLASLLLTRPEAFEILFPGFFVTHSNRLDLSHPFWDWLRTQGCTPHGESFWFRLRSRLSPIP